LGTASKAERLEIYKDRTAQVVLGKFLVDELKEIEPIYDPKHGYRYECVESITGDPLKTEVFLEKLHSAGILARKLHDEVIFCPKCNSASISLHYCCPYCKSFDIRKSGLIEHVKCGYMDIEENFQKTGSLICPKCHDELKEPDVDYRRAGIWCSCKNCDKSFDIPTVKLYCRSCHVEFSFEDATIKNVYTYSLKEEARKEAAEGWVLIPPISEFMSENGFEVKSPGYLRGKSGANHMFDIVATQIENKKVTVIDLATSPDNIVSEQPVIALFAKMFDVSPNTAYLIAIPRLNDNGKKMAELYNIQAIESKNQKEAIECLKQRVTKTKT